MILSPREISGALHSSEGSQVRQDELCLVKRLEVKSKMGALLCKELNTPRFCWTWQNFMGCSIYITGWLAGWKERSNDTLGFILDLEIYAYEDHALAPLQAQVEDIFLCSLVLRTTDISFRLNFSILEKWYGGTYFLSKFSIELPRRQLQINGIKQKATKQGMGLQFKSVLLK